MDTHQSPVVDLTCDIIDLTQEPDSPVVQRSLTKKCFYQPKRIRLNPVQEVLTILPNAKLFFVEAMYGKYENTDNPVNDAVEEMLQTGYEKESNPVEIDFASTLWSTSQLYRYHALLLLQSSFPFIKPDGLQSLFVAMQHHYSPTYKAVLDTTDCVATYDSDGLINHIYTDSHMTAMVDRLTANRALLHGIEISIQEVPVDLTNYSFERLDAVLQQELDWMENRLIEAVMKKNDDVDHRAIISGASVECGCCFGDYALDNMRQCTKGHLFCSICIAKYVEQTVFGDGRSHLKCLSSIGSSSGAACDGHFSDATIRASVRGKVFSRYCEAVARDALKAAKLDESMKTCYYCQFQVEVDSPDIIVIRCPNCYKSTCILCNQEAHQPARCSRPESQTETHGRVAVEEAMTKARVRVCPRCKTPVIKADGCNWVMCRCGTGICYTCGVETVCHFHCPPPCEVTEVQRAGIVALEMAKTAAKAAGEDATYNIDVNQFLHGGI